MKSRSLNRKCMQCKEDFKAKQVTSRFCGRKCSAKFLSRPCDQCGKKLKGRTTLRQIYCNRKCRNDYFNS